MAHFYTDAGEARHEVKTASKTAKNPTRPSTIKDARKNGWLPSATTILDVIGAEGLVTWKMNQVCKFARQVPDECADAAALIHAKQKMAEHLDEAANAGTALHNELEEYTLLWTAGDRSTPHWDKLFAEADIVKVLYSEKMMASRKLGYAGTGDILGINSKGQLVVFDLKTKDTNGKVESRKTYRNEKYELQLGCYANLSRHDDCPKIKEAVKKGVVSCIAYVSRDEFVDGGQGERWTKVELFDEMQTLEAGTAYQGLFQVWTWLKKYDPRLEF